MVVTRRGQGQFAHVVLEVEVGILDPVRVIETERNRREPPAERRQQMHALQQHRGHPLRSQDTARRRRRVVDREARDVAMGTAVLHGEELRVEASQLADTAILDRTRSYVTQ